MGRRRYLVVALMFLVTFINYMDRVNFSVSIPAIRQQFGFDLHQIGQIAFVWGLAYGLFNFPGGWIADRMGLRWGMLLALGWWSIFTIATPFAGSLAGWYAVRALMGAGEAPIWPYAKVANSWAAPKERSTAYTWAGSGQYIGPAVGSILAGWIVVRFGWEWSFILFGAVGMVILPFWVAIVRDRPEQDTRLSEEERQIIGNRSSHEESADWPGIRAVFASRTGIGMLLIYLTFGYILSTFLYWVPSYMFYTFHMGILNSAMWSSLGSLLGFAGFFLSGPFNDYLVRRCKNRLTARRVGAALPMALAAICVVLSLTTARARLGEVTAMLLGIVQLLMNTTVGAWAVAIIDISPNQTSTGFVYGIFNGVLNVMGAFNSLILTSLASSYGFPLAFGSALAFMAVFLVSIPFVVDGGSYGHLVERAQCARLCERPA